MIHNLLRAGALSCALLTSTCLTAPAAAQGLAPPPRQDTQSPAGVSLQSGAFNLEQRDLAIGGAAFPHGLTLDRSYASNLAEDYAAFAGYRTQGWTNNLNIRIGSSELSTPMPMPAGQEIYLFSVSIGNRSVGFIGGGAERRGGFVGSYEPVNVGGERLTFSGDHDSGHFTFTDSDGTILVFNPQNAPGRAAMAIASWTAPDGTRADFTYDADGLRSVISNRGYALLFERGDVPGPVAGQRALVKACAVNMTAHHVTPTSACPAGVQTVSYHYTAGNLTPMLTGVTDAAGRITSYGYTSRDHLGCVTLPEQDGCQVSNSYSLCTPPPSPDSPQPVIPPGMTLQEKVVSQVTAAGIVYRYSFPETSQCPNDDPPAPVTMTVGGGATPPAERLPTTVVTNGDGMPLSVTDALGRTTSMSYVGRQSWTSLGQTPSTLATVTRPEGNWSEYEYDGRGNIVEERLHAKPEGPGEDRPADIVRTATYAATCDEPRICNRPLSVVDARGNATEYDYESLHGGVIRETGPAADPLATSGPDSIRPEVRYTYEQRYAWILNAAGGYSRAPTPVWVRTSERRCRTSRATGNVATPCETPNDESVTVYGYGPDAGPNNLQLRGTVVDPGGASLRTCFAYDSNGNRTGETGARAGLANCP